MSFRTRLAIAVAVLVALAIAGSGAVAGYAAEREIVGEIDHFLEDRAEDLGALGGDLRTNGRRPRRLDPGALDQADAVTQVITSRGDILLAGQVELPVAEIDRDIADGDRKSSIRTVRVDGVEYRMITASVGENNAAVQIARDLVEADAAVAGLRGRLLVFGLLGAALAAAVAWALASRLSRPMQHLTEAAGHVAATQDLSATIDVDRRDEVGRLGHSFNTMLSALDTSRQQQRRLVMDASHELRTPLTSVRTNVDLLRRAKTLTDDQQAEVLDAVSSEVDELTALVGELVDLATASSRPDEPFVDTDLAALAGDVAERFQRRTGRTISVTNDATAFRTVQASMIDRALSNLVDNALKFSSPDTEVDIEVRGGTVTVRDRGPGIADVDQARVFDRFYRATATRSMPGSGLGLAIVREIVDAHGGRVLVGAPPEGPGALLGFELP